jgi:hypothetical protein
MISCDSCLHEMRVLAHAETQLILQLNFEMAF